MSNDIQQVPEETTGQLTKLLPGSYFIVPGVGKTAIGRPSVSLIEETSAVLLEQQGKTCWHALVDGQALLVWDHNFVEKPIVK
jgi:hypothetical protein